MKPEEWPMDLRVYAERKARESGQPEPALREARENAKASPADPEQLKEPRTKAVGYPPQPVRRMPDKETLRQSPNTNKGLQRQHRFYKKCFLEMYRNLEALELTETTISRLFGISSTTLYKNTQHDEETQRAYQEAMAELECRMSRMMLVKAIGYTYEDEKITYEPSEGDDEWIPTKKEVWIKHQAGDAGLFIMFMTNKFPDLWKVSKELVTQKKEGYDRFPAERVRKQIVALARDVSEADSDESQAEHSVQG